MYVIYLYSYFGNLLSETLYSCYNVVFHSLICKLTIICCYNILLNSVSSGNKQYKSRKRYYGYCRTCRPFSPALYTIITVCRNKIYHRLGFSRVGKAMALTIISPLHSK